MIVRIVRGQRWVFDDRRRFVSPPDPEPYEPCWCFSGVKYKFCHQHRHREKPISVEREVLRTWETIPAVPARCFHPDAPSGCGTMIRAHTVQRGGFGLNSLALAGKVYGLRLHPTFFAKSDLRFVPALIGINQASTFPLFCAAHDGALFRDLETQPFSGLPNQLMCLDFRAVASRLLANEEGVRPAIPENSDRGLSRHAQRWLFAELEDMRVMAEHALQNLKIIKSECDKALRANISPMNALMVTLLGRPEVMCSALVSAEVDFAANKIPPVPAPAHMSFHLLGNSATSGVAVFTWMGVHGGAEQLCRSFMQVPDDQKAHALLQYACEHVDLLYFAPAWWDRVSERDQELVVERMTEAAHPLRARRTDALVDDGLRVSSMEFGGSQSLGSW